MAIERVSGSGGLERPDRLGPSKETPGPAGSSPVEPGDRIELSDEARRIAALADQAQLLPELRAEHVEALRSAVAGGTYEVNARKLAEAILEFEDEFRG